MAKILSALEAFYHGSKRQMMPKRQVFYSPHFDNDVMQVQQIRNINAIKDNKPASINDWQEVNMRGESSIEKWIDENINHRSCVKYEIRKAWKNRTGVLGIHIHNIKYPRNGKSNKWSNSFDLFTFKDVSKLSSKVSCYNPDPNDVYDDIKNTIEASSETAIAQRK